MQSGHTEAETGDYFNINNIIEFDEQNDSKRTETLLELH